MKYVIAIVAAIVAAVLAIAAPAFAEKAPLPKAPETKKVDHFAALAECLTNEDKGPGLTQGDEQQVRAKKAHFTIREIEVDGKTEKVVSFYPGLLAGNTPGLNVAKVNACMKKFQTRF